MKFFSSVRQVKEDVHFIVNRRHLLKLPVDPVFDEATRNFFDKYIADTDVFVEYGAGGATLHAARCASVVVSVESDKEYLKLVKQQLAALALPAEMIMCFVNIGPTAAWGYPVLRRGWRAISGRGYAKAPWVVLEERSLKANFVLIDGRYRVACMLASLLNPFGANAVYLFDDFSDRPYYDAVLDYIDVIERPGRSIVARRRANIDVAACHETLKQHLNDCR